MAMNIIWKDRKRTLFGLPLSFTKYELTEDRLFIKTGLLTQKEDEVRLYRIMDIGLTRTLGQRIFGVAPYTAPPATRRWAISTSRASRCRKKSRKNSLRWSKSRETRSASSTAKSW